MLNNLMRRMKLIQLIFLIILVVMLNSCYYDKYDVLYPALTVCDTTNVTYSATISSIVQNNCLICHSDNAYQSLGGGYNLDGYTNFKNVATMNNSTLLINCINWAPGCDQMPNTGTKLPPCDIMQITKWINAGAQNN